MEQRTDWFQLSLTEFNLNLTHTYEFEPSGNVVCIVLFERLQHEKNSLVIRNNLWLN
jgi:uncharacterized protein YkuJ